MSDYQMHRCNLIYYRGVEIYVYRSAYAVRSPYRRSPVGGELFHRQVVRTPESTRERPGSSS
jgi:hypothetical protein